MPSTTLRLRIALAKTVSPDGYARNVSANPVGRIGIVSAIAAGEKRSGSGNSKSNPIALGLLAAMRSINSAMRVRGHGHWPSLARLFSSISTMIAGSLIRVRGNTRW